MTITKDNIEFLTIESLKEALINTIHDEQETYAEESGWYNMTDDQLNFALDSFIESVSDDEVDEFQKWCMYPNRDEAILNLLNEWMFGYK